MTSITHTLETLYACHNGHVSDKWASYLLEYGRLFESRRNDPVRLLEIGVQNGGSLEIWSKFFPNANSIIGCDINPVCANISYPDRSIKLVIGDIKDAKTRNTIADHSHNFDIIIDDGSHTSADIIETFCLLSPKLSSYGIYIIEDLHCSYWDSFGGGLSDPTSSIAFFKLIADVLHFEHWGLDKTRTSLFEHFDIPSDLTEEFLAEIHSIQFLNSMCVITKAPKDRNLLGKRCVVGSHETVSPVKHVAGTYLKPQTQHVTKELKSARESSKDQLIATLQSQILNLESRLNKKDET